VPQKKDLAELNAYLRDYCLKDQARVSGDHTETIGQRFQRERAWPLPATRFDACIYQPSKIGKYQTVRCDQARYSVPQCYAFQTATVSCPHCHESARFVEVPLQDGR
jgi:hypothetical protein